MTRSSATVGLVLACLSSSAAAELVPHTATYELTLASRGDNLDSAEARIAVEIERTDCSVWSYDYRFAARFVQDGLATLTDQRTEARESVDGSRFEFRTTSEVDGTMLATVAGTATVYQDRSVVSLTEPDRRSVELPPVHFPIAHTAEIIAAAKEGRAIIQSDIYDGDEEPEKRLTSTAIITPLDAAQGRDGAEPPDALDGIQRWRISEAFYDTDSGPDGLPIFETVYTLYENGISDHIALQFDGYTLEGSLSDLQIGRSPDCP